MNPVTQLRLLRCRMQIDAIEVTILFIWNKSQKHSTFLDEWKQCLLCEGSTCSSVIRHKLHSFNSTVNSQIRHWGSRLHHQRGRVGPVEEVHRNNPINGRLTDFCSSLWRQKKKDHRRDDSGRRENCHHVVCQNQYWAMPAIEMRLPFFKFSTDGFS